MTVTPAVYVVGRSERIALATARAASAIALCGAAFSPPLTNVALFVSLVSVVVLPETRVRLLKAACLPVARAAMFLFGVMVLAMSWSDAPWGIRAHALSDWRTLPLMLVMLSVFSTSTSKSRCVTTLIAFAVVGALLSFGSWWFERPMIPDHLPGTVFRNSSTQSMVFVVALTSAVVLAAWRSPPTVATAQPRMHALYWGAAALLFANLLFITTGRSGQLAVVIIAATLATCLLRGRTRTLLLVAVPLGAAAVIATSPVVQKRFELGWNEMQAVEHAPALTSMGMRVVMWRTSLEVIKERPWTGYGTGGFGPAYARKTAQINSDWRAIPTVDPHNQYLFVWASAGVLGLVAFAAFLAVAAWQPAVRPWKQVSLALLLAWIATSLFSSHFQTFAEGHLIVLLLGVFLAPESNDQSASRTVDSTSP